MKKLLLIICVATILALVGCSENQEETSTDNNTAEEDQNNNSNSNENEDEQQNNEQEKDIPNLSKEEAQKLLVNYEDTFFVGTSENGVSNYETKEELLADFKTVMSSEIAQKFVERHFSVEDGSLQIVAMDAPSWLEENRPFKLNQKDEKTYTVTQEQSGELVGHRNLIFELTYNSDRWVVNSVKSEDLGEISQQEAEEVVQGYIDETATVSFENKKNGKYIFKVINGDKESWYKVDQLSKTVIKSESKSGKEVDLTAVEDMSTAIVEALATSDFEKVSQFVGSEQGVLIPPYQYINDDAVELQKDDIANISKDNTVYHWGTEDGSGKPIESTSQEYFKRYQEFSEYNKVLINNIKQRGNTENNINERFPDAQVVEFYKKGTDANSNMDWASLYVVLEEGENGILQLVALVSGQWTI